MREILFRAKAINRNPNREYRTDYKNGDWVYGLVSKLYDEDFHENFPHVPAEMTNENGISGIDVDYKTIGQYTGLIDKNGNKIFEGDIIATRSIGHKAVVACIVRYGEFEDVDSDDDSLKYLGWYLETHGAKCSILTPLGDDIEYEVIGNIYDNPEPIRGDE